MGRSITLRQAGGQRYEAGRRYSAGSNSHELLAVVRNAGGRKSGSKPLTLQCTTGRGLYVVCYSHCPGHLHMCNAYFEQIPIFLSTRRRTSLQGDCFCPPHTLACLLGCVPVKELHHASAPPPLPAVGCACIRAPSCPRPPPPCLLGCVPVEQLHHAHRGAHLRRTNEGVLRGLPQDAHRGLRVQGILGVGEGA